MKIIKLKAILAVTLFSLVINGSAWAKIWNCELAVTDASGDQPCIVGATDGDWVKGLKHIKDDAAKQKDYEEYYKQCNNMTNVIKKINEDELTCLVGGSKYGWNTIFFKTDDVMAKDSKFKSPSNSNDKKVIAGELWADRSDFNGGEITITDNSTIKAERTVLVAGYNVLVDNGKNDTCLGDPNDNGPCKYKDGLNMENNTLDDEPINVGGSDQCEDYGDCGGDDFGAEPDWDSGEPPPNFDDPPEDGSDYPVTVEEGGDYPMEGDEVKEGLEEQAAQEWQNQKDMIAGQKEVEKEQTYEYKGSQEMSGVWLSGELCPPGYREHEATGDEGQHLMWCLDGWFDDIQDGNTGYYYAMSLNSPANWTGDYAGEDGMVTIFAGDRKQHGETFAPFGSYSKITINNKNSNSSAFTVKGTLILRDLQIVVEKGRLATIESGGRLFLENVVISCGDHKKACDSDSLIKNNGQLFVDPNARFYISKKVISKIPENFGYIDSNKDSTVYFYSPENAYIATYTTEKILKFNDKQNYVSQLGMLNATVLPGDLFPIKTDKEKIVKINLGFEKYYTAVLKDMNLDKCLTVFSISMGYLISNGADDLLLSLSDKLSDPYSPYFDRLFICGDTAYKFERDCVDDGYIIEAGGKISCQPHPGGGWEYDEGKHSFVCGENGGGVKLGDGTCLKNGCPYGSVSNSGASDCECPAGTEKFESEGSFICIKTCSEKDQINWIKKDLLKDGSADGTNLKGKTLVYFGNLGGSSDGFKALSNKDRCDCVSPYTMLFNGTCVNVADKDTNCKTTKGGGAIYDTSTDSCKCAEGYLDIKGKCEASLNDTCKAKGKDWKFAEATNTCVCKIIDADLTTCACPAGTVKDASGFKTSCVSGTEPPAECSENSECDDGESCKDGECVDKDNPKKGFGEECKEDVECDGPNGLECYESKCACDTANDWNINDNGDGCEYDEPEPIDAMCTLAGGTYISSEGYCEFNKSIATCKVSGGTWENSQCSNGDDPPLAKKGGDCTLVPGTASAGSMGTVLAYLTMLGSILLVRVRRAKLK